ncbi:MAG: prepilin-type N-terminal cleavage/methylation domain-containing protein [Candidatus Riflebacteria bacterium]|nr:prepilin-type N-terminal cleavage/methylation domain-containing protein [Candidatus Riflebacteria bacterium]
MSSGKRRGMSMIELTITITVIAIAVLPLLSSIGSTSRTVYSMGKHQLAALVTRSILDRLMLLPYEDCRKKCLELGSEINVIDDEEIKSLISRIDFDQKDYDQMTCRVIVKDAASVEEQELMFIIEVLVSWPVPNSAERRDFSFKTIKYENRI